MILYLLCLCHAYAKQANIIKTKLMLKKELLYPVLLLLKRKLGNGAWTLFSVN